MLIKLLLSKFQAPSGLLSMLQNDTADYLQTDSDTSDDDCNEVDSCGDVYSLSETEIEELVSQRTKARSNKDWVEGDRIRDLLGYHGVMLEDSLQKTNWRWK